jgi:NAD(P)-dependent dehydrogenase (short-subunit alcohol dehydrogenase family)
MAHPFVRVALFIRDGGSNSSYRWFCRPGIYTNVNVKLGRNIAGRKSNDLRRASLPEEIAAIIAFLCSPARRKINDQVVTASACEEF